ncbi:MAG TPA: YIP1 family protein [Telluria sp.]
MFHSPTAAFSMLEPRRHAWLPLVLLIAASAGVLMWYFAVVDFAWLQDRMFASMRDAAQREQAGKVMSRGTLQTMSVAAAVAGIPFVAAVTALYLTLVSKFTHSELPFGKGFALALWSSVPILLVQILGAIQIALNPDGRLDLGQLNPVSLNQLFFHIEMGRPWSSLLDSVSVVSIWNMVLLVIGYQVWTRVPRATAAKVVLIPYAVIYAIWAVSAMLST